MLRTFSLDLADALLRATWCFLRPRTLATYCVTALFASPSRAGALIETVTVSPVIRRALACQQRVFRQALPQESANSAALAQRTPPWHQAWRG